MGVGVLVGVRVTVGVDVGVSVLAGVAVAVVVGEDVEERLWVALAEGVAVATRLAENPIWLQADSNIMKMDSGYQ